VKSALCEHTGQRQWSTLVTSANSELIADRTPLKSRPRWLATEMS